MTQYLLPCSCGRKTPVEPRQAGQVIVCDCGAKQSVPAMSMMGRLDRFEPPPADRSSASPWGVRKGMLLLGIVILLASSGFAVYLLTIRPMEPDSKLTFEFIQQESQNLKPAQSWLLWRTLRADGPKRNQPPDMKAYHEALLRFRLSMAAVLGIGGVGIVLTVVGLWKKGPSPKDVPGS